MRVAFGTEAANKPSGHILWQRALIVLINGLTLPVEMDGVGVTHDLSRIVFRTSKKGARYLESPR